MNDHGEQIRIVQETVAGKEITFAHVMGGPVVLQKYVQVGASCVVMPSLTVAEGSVVGAM